MTPHAPVTPSLPTAALAVVGATEWPTAPAARHALSSALFALPDRTPWRELVAWAFALHHDPEAGGASVRAVCETLCISRARLHAWRALDPVVGALPATRRKRAPGVTIKGDTRAAREAARGRPRGRPRVPLEGSPGSPPEAPRDALARIAAAPGGAAVRTHVDAMVRAYDGEADDEAGLAAALDTLRAMGLAAAEAGAAARGFIAERMG